MQHIPWTEKYRPQFFDDIVLDPINKTIFKNILNTCYFPNLLFYGPPGTGKTTTIINLINSYQLKSGSINKSLIIHLNASDDRGIDVIRNQINTFVMSQPLFNNGTKFVILDEVDYMTKNAQQALHYLLYEYNDNVRFCLICNYISRIDDSLQTEFLKLRFSQLPQKNIIDLLNKISINENLNMKEKTLETIQTMYKSDVRSMINFMQTNINENQKYNIIEENHWENLFEKLCSLSNNNTNTNTSLPLPKETFINANSLFDKLCKKYNYDKSRCLLDFINYIIRKKEHVVTNDFLYFVKKLSHFTGTKNHIYVNYTIIQLLHFLTIEP
jgi:replication factor C subunit 3/5